MLKSEYHSKVTFEVPVGGKGIPKVIKIEDLSDYDKCYKNLQLIEAGKEMVTKFYNKKDGDPADIREVDEYIKGGHPKCPQGGEYIYGAVGEPPRCTIHGALEEY